MINTAPPASNSVYGREKLFWYEFFNSCVSLWCSVQGIACTCSFFADKLGSTPGDSVFCFLYHCFSCLVFFFSIFPFGLFSLFLLLTLLVMHLDQYVFKLKSGVLFWKNDFKSSWSAYWPSLRPDKKHKPCQDMSLLWNSWIFSMLVDILTNNTQYTTNYTSLHPTPISDTLAKVKLAFRTSS